MVLEAPESRDHFKIIENCLELHCGARNLDGNLVYEYNPRGSTQTLYLEFTMDFEKFINMRTFQNQEMPKSLYKYCTDKRVTRSSSNPSEHVIKYTLIADRLDEMVDALMHEVCGPEFDKQIDELCSSEV